jgi:hypothetical protein
MATKRGALTKDQWAQKWEEQQRTIEELRRENRRIESALARVLQTRSEMKDDIADQISEEIEALSDKIEEYQVHGTPEEIADERAAMLRALNMDEYEWHRARWRY